MQARLKVASFERCAVNGFDGAACLAERCEDADDGGSDANSFSHVGQRQRYEAVKCSSRIRSMKTDCPFAPHATYPT